MTQNDKQAQKGTEQGCVSLTIALPGHDIMIGIYDNANESRTNSGMSALLKLANAGYTRQHAPASIAVHSSKSSHSVKSFFCHDT